MAKAEQETLMSSDVVRMRRSSLSSRRPPDLTLGNWRKPPFSRWAFRHVRDILPTSLVRAGGPASRLPSDRRSIPDIKIDLADRSVDVTEFLHAADADGLIVLHRGRIALEWYDSGFTSDQLHVVFSVSKSICGALGGILIDQGFFDPEERITHYIPELCDSAFSDTLVRHVFDMGVAVAFEEDYTDPENDCARYRVASGWDPPSHRFDAVGTRSFLASLRSNGARHGEAFHYVSPNTDLLGWLYERVTGLSYAELLSRYLWTPLGAQHDAAIAVDAEGLSRAAGGFCTTLPDLARLGEMMRNGGVTDGRQVVPRWWIDDIRKGGSTAFWNNGGSNPLSDLFPDAVYRNQWFNLGSSILFALGIHGQGLYIDHDADIVIARMSSRPVAADLVNEAVWTKVYAGIVEAFRS